MKKTFCDRCGAECNGEPLQRFTIFDVNRAIDVCEDCYKEFFRWLNNKDIFDKNVPGTHIKSIEVAPGLYAHIVANETTNAVNINDLDDAYRFIKKDMEEKDEN